MPSLSNSTVRFQSTRPVWGATFIAAAPVDEAGFQSTRPVWGATMVLGVIDELKAFQSTRPVWGATCGIVLREPEEQISIHAPRVGRDP